MSISRKRAGRRSWETRMRYAASLGQAVQNIADLEFKYSAAETKSMVIERHSRSGREVITFARAYGELSGWVDKSFANISNMGLSDALVEIFRSGACLYTPKAKYKLFTR